MVYLFVSSSVATFLFFFFKQKTAYEMRSSDWSSYVCSSDLFETPCCARLLTMRCQYCLTLRSLAQQGVSKGEANCSGQPTSISASRRLPARAQIGSALCRERVCQYV